MNLPTTINDWLLMILVLFIIVFEIYDIIKKLHSSTSYTYTAPTTPTTSTASDCQAIKDYYTSSGFGRSSIMNDALTAAGCDPVQL